MPAWWPSWPEKGFIPSQTKRSPGLLGKLWLAPFSQSRLPTRCCRSTIMCLLQGPQLAGPAHVAPRPRMWATWSARTAHLGTSTASKVRPRPHERHPPSHTGLIIGWTSLRPPCSLLAESAPAAPSRPARIAHVCSGLAACRHGMPASSSRHLCQHHRRILPHPVVSLPWPACCPPPVQGLTCTC